MSVREGLLVLLAAAPTHGYQLKHDYDAALAGPKALNVGQVYITLDRLARDGLVREHAAAGTAEDEGDDARRRTFEVTEAGRAAIAAWFATPVGASVAVGRDELVAKVVLALQTEGIDALDVIQTERAALVGVLQSVRREMRTTVELGPMLTIDARAARLEAEIGWLDRCEERVREARRPEGRSTTKGSGR